MCQFVSWVERRGKVYFLTSEQLESERGQKWVKEEKVSPDDLCGHGTIRLWYRIDAGDGVDKEQTDFTRPSDFPPEIAEAVKAGKFNSFPLPKGLLRMALDDDYWDKCMALNADYWAKRNALDNDYWTKHNALDDDYWDKRNALGDDYRAKYNALDDDYRDKCMALNADYWALFTSPENRAIKWR